MFKALDKRKKGGAQDSIVAIKKIRMVRFTVLNHKGNLFINHFSLRDGTRKVCLSLHYAKSSYSKNCTMKTSSVFLTSMPDETMSTWSLSTVLLISKR